MLVFLGGTVGKNDWRDEFINRAVERGIARESLFNPVVKDWNEKAQEIEDEMKRKSDFNLFFITNPHTEGNEVSGYSLVEAVMGLYDNPERTLVVFDLEEYSPTTRKSMLKIKTELEKRFGVIFNSLGEVIDFLVDMQYDN